MSDDREVIDVEAVEIADSPNLPAVQASTRTRIDTGSVPRWSEEWWAGVSPETRARRCVAHKSNGERCLKLAIKGATVCRTHGGATKHVKRAARARLENAADLMAKQLLGIALTADSEAVKLAAIKDSLDRAGLKAPSEVVLSQGEAKPYEQVFDVIGGNPSDTSSAGLNATPASAYGEYGNGVKAEAGAAHTPYGDTGYDDARSPADEQPQSSWDGGPLGQGRAREFDRERRQQPREMHITGEAAMRLANEANRQAGVFEAQRAIESPHRRYRRP